MAQSVNLWGATYSDVPAIEVPKSGGGTASFTDVTDTTAAASDVASGKYFYTAAGVRTQGTGSGGGGGYVTQDQDGYIVLPSTGGGGGGGATQHVIHLEFSDSTDTDVDVYYDDSLIGTMITAYEPSVEWTYNNKIITSAALDNVEWYEYTPIPLNTELVDYSACTQGYRVDENGDAYAQQWSWISDYVSIKAGMTFTYKNYYWFHIGIYDSSKNFIRAIAVSADSTPDPNDSNTGIGTLSGDKIPSNAAYVRLCGQTNSATYMSLIRTA